MFMTDESAVALVGKRVDVFTRTHEVEGDVIEVRIGVDYKMMVINNAVIHNKDKDIAVKDEFYFDFEDIKSCIKS